MGTFIYSITLTHNESRYGYGAREIMSMSALKSEDRGLGNIETLNKVNHRLNDLSLHHMVRSSQEPVVINIKARTLVEGTQDFVYIDIEHCLVPYVYKEDGEFPNILEILGIKNFEEGKNCPTELWSV
jgi:hypothetical protein